MSKPKLLGEVVDGKLYGPGAAPPAAVGGLGGKTAREVAIEGISEATPLAVKVITEALRKPTVERNQQHLHTLARYVLDVVLERLPEAEAKPVGTVAQLTPDAAVRELRRRLSGGDE